MRDYCRDIVERRSARSAASYLVDLYNVHWFQKKINEQIVWDWFAVSRGDNFTDVLDKHFHGPVGSVFDRALILQLSERFK